MALSKVTPTQLRSAIDAGETGEKTAFPDPATAPLGTDEEAAGDRALPSIEPIGRAPAKQRDGLLAFVVIAAGIGVLCIAAAILGLVQAG